MSEFLLLRLRLPNYSRPKCAEIALDENCSHVPAVDGRLDFCFFGHLHLYKKKDSALEDLEELLYDENVLSAWKYPSWKLNFIIYMMKQFNVLKINV